MAPARNSNVQLLAVLVDWNDEEEGEYHFLVDGKDTKYVTVELHGDINKYNFLIRERKAILVDFEASQRCNEKQELEAEYEQLEASLSDISQRGGPYSDIWEDQQAFQQ
ncbi:hypothetical protein J3E68DRAFT_422923 [Trichoderma sp. SZMC 28012]